MLFWQRYHKNWYLLSKQPNLSNNSLLEQPQPPGELRAVPNNDGTGAVSSVWQRCHKEAWLGKMVETLNRSNVKRSKNQTIEERRWRRSKM
jgi:hypothetical protein